ncbi:putative aminoacyltransferase, E1 ubiquitin-activating enzyme [Lupinus albus]|uniref:Putative aminoacyltransferase, E1 ubiquitin-activating enzyme n=1 Tax=Lupinus albus TaxID=3870 RepID=A0A6A4Q0C5_LUPAL|nr:putative aminoacyltransferase, E1 ubiquitin-activating enzyme [Lupinus albus]
MPAQKQRSNETPEEDFLTSDGNNNDIPVHEVESDRNHSSRNGDKKEYVIINLADVRKEVQCPICLGIIRKTRTVMECLHRFCRECIDKSMRLGNNECPACRTHCASRRSLRDDPNFDTLIAALYPDIDKYEEEELALHEDEKTQNKLIQDSIARTFQRQTEALGKRRNAKATAVAFARRSQGNYQTSHLRRKRNVRNGGEFQVSNGSEDMNSNDEGKYSSSGDEEAETKPKRGKTGAGTRFPQHFATTNAYAAVDENIPELSKEIISSSTALAWGKNGHRSHTRVNGKNARNSRLYRLVDHLHNSEITDDELDINIMVVSLDEESIPSMERPYLRCKSTLSVRLLCQYVALQAAVQADKVELFLVKDPQANIIRGERLVVPDKDGLHVLSKGRTLVELKIYDNLCLGYLVMAYKANCRTRTQLS